MNEDRTHVLIVHQDPAAEEGAYDDLPGVVVLAEVMGYERAVEEADYQSPDVVLVVAAGDVEATRRLVEALAGEPHSLPVVVVSPTYQPSTVTRYLAAGARNVVPAGDAGALALALTGASRPLKSRRPSRRGRIFTVYSGKGGVGKTTLAANLAAALSVVTTGKVAVVDLDLSFGDVHFQMCGTDLKARTTIHDLVSLPQLEPDQVERAMISAHRCPVRILSAVGDPEKTEDVGAREVREVLQALKSHYDYVVVDTPSNFDDRTLEALEMAGVVLLVAAPDVPTVAKTSISLASMQKLGYSENKVRLVLNRADTGVGARRVEEALAYRVWAQIPSDGRVVLRAVNEGVPFVLTAPRSRAARAVTAMALQLAHPADVRKPARRLRLNLGGAR